jgi:hypothetical protein
MKTQINEAFALRRKSFTNTFIISDKVSCLLGLDSLSYVSFMDGLLVYVMTAIQLEVLALC